MFSKNILRKVFEIHDLARLDWSRREVVQRLNLVLPPVSIIWGVSRDWPLK